ncbi:MAG TPA: GNAT family N-acetyltransferase [Actinophytocola sp.]|uniref:GNAT family N-acetyltransferase n=1 Tax=Actinophytocola sp. TaxID=1872138 RepID=UPI002DB58E35|nr:GNAT family N-acetyltransferase [Actinophytocola sp.]HEU5471188.1 GNAT family N-acetyltransferase [Actinophytocola sp.]
MRVEAPVLLREATVSDAGAIGDVHADAWHVAYRDLFEPNWLRKLVAKRRVQWASRFGAPNFERTTLLVAVRDDRVCAFAYFGPHGLAADPPAVFPLGRVRYGDGEIYGFYAHPSVWGSGVAPSLMDSAWERLGESGHRTVRLWTLAGANRARRFYTRFGFRESGATRERDFGDGRPVLEVEYLRSTR